MTTSRFIEYLQEILTMVDLNNEFSVVLAKNAILATIGLAQASQKTDFMTGRIMRCAELHIEQLLRQAEEFAGKRGDFIGNEQKRRRLEAMLSPHC